MFLWRKGHVLTGMVDEYLGKAEECLKCFREGLETYFARGLGADFDTLVEKTRMAESTCDDLRRQIETAMYEKSLIPESRGDVLGLMESLDRVPNRAESVLYMIQTQSLRTPEPYFEKFQQLIRINHETFQNLAQAVRLLFKDGSRVRSLTRDIDKQESVSDDVEREIIRSLFSSPDVLPDQKILLKELVIEIGSISDLCENVADRLTIITLKRLV